jgi:uncharacterized protein (TIGR03067 family)
MMRLLALYVALGPLAADPPRELQSTWRLKSAEIDGKTIELIDSQARWAIQGNKVSYGGEELAVLTADPAATPKTIDLAFFNPKRTYEAIYAVEKDTLKICLNGRSDGVKERPLVFTTQGKEHWRLLTFEREEDADLDRKENLRGFVGVALRRDEDRNEILVNDVFDDSPAQRGGLRRDDVVLKIGDEEVAELAPAVQVVRRAKPGSQLTFRVRRDGQEKDIVVQVGFVPFGVLVQLE